MTTVARTTITIALAFAVISVGTPAVAAPKLSLNLGPGEADFLQALMSCERTETPERCERRLRREIKKCVDNSAGPQTFGRTDKPAGGH